MFSDLVLLIGTNPLPNYVTARYMIDQHGESLKRIWLVHSETTRTQKGTKQLADDFQYVIKKYFSGDLFFVALNDVGSAQQIKNDIQKKFLDELDLLDQDAMVHLNYTGGTKAMAVHVYRTLENELNMRRLTCSYLDAREYKLHSDNENKWISGDLRDKVFIDLEDLAYLHGYKKHDRNQDSDKKPKKDIVSKKDSKELWENIWQFFYNQVLKGDLERCDDSQKVLLEKIIKGDEENNKDRVDSLIRDLLRGKWLEKYVAECLNDKLASRDEGINKHVPIETNWELIKNGPEGKKFELDIILINGYQICGISCTTSDKEGRCKEKGFEVLFRLEQIGGSESKAVLVTCLNEKGRSYVEKDLMMISGSTEEKILVLGIDDLSPDILWKKIRDHVFRS